MHTKKPKICYIVPEYSEDTDTHFYHIYELIEVLKEKADIFLIAAKGKKFRRRLGILRARLAGYKDFYVHYSFKAALFAILIVKIFGGRVFYWNCGMPWLYKRNWLRERVFRFILRNSTLVTGTNSLKNQYAQIYNLKPRNIRVLPNWVNIERFEGFDKIQARKELNISPEKKVVLFLHRLSVRKGADKLPAIIKEFKNYPDILFLIIGSGPESRNLKFEIRNLKLGDIVRFEGAVPNKAVPKYMIVSDVFLMPSEEEGFPRVLLEAMASGLPFVASDVGGVKEIIPSEIQEFVIPQQDIEEFSRKIKKLLSAPLLYQEFQQIEREWVKQYDIKTVADKFVGLFEINKSAF